MLSGTKVMVFVRLIHPYFVFLLHQSGIKTTKMAIYCQWLKGSLIQNTQYKINVVQQQRSRTTCARKSGICVSKNGSRPGCFECSDGYRTIVISILVVIKMLVNLLSIFRSCIFLFNPTAQRRSCVG
jgi:hypothetical protein